MGWVWVVKSAGKIAPASTPLTLPLITTQQSLMEECLRTSVAEKERGADEGSPEGTARGWVGE